MFVYVLTELTADGILSTFEICRTQIHYQDKHSDSDTLNRFVGAVLWPHGGTTSHEWTHCFLHSAFTEPLDGSAEVILGETGLDSVSLSPGPGPYLGLSPGPGPV